MISPQVVKRDAPTGDSLIKVVDFYNTNAALNALATMEFWRLIGIPLCKFPFIVQNNQEPIITNSGDFITLY